MQVKCSPLETHVLPVPHKPATRSLVCLPIAIRQSGDVTILRFPCRSRISNAESALLRRRLQKLVAGGARKLLLNLTNLIQVDNFFAGLIVRAFVTLRNAEGDLRLVSPRVRALEVFSSLRLMEIIPTFEDESQALASFNPLSRFAGY